MGKKSNQVLKITHLDYTYPGAKEPALDDINLTLQENTINMVIGPNGSGKSTLAKLIIGSLVGEGEISFYNEGKKISRKQAHLGYVPQKKIIDTTVPITVNELLKLTQQSCNRCNLDSDQEITTALKKVNAHDYRSKKNWRPFRRATAESNFGKSFT